MVFTVTPTRLTSGVWGAIKKGASWVDHKLGKGADFIDEQWRNRARPALESTLGKWMMDRAANSAGTFVEGSIAPARVILDKTIPLLKALPQTDTIKTITEAVRDTNDYFAKAGDMTRNYVSPGSVDRRAPSKKPKRQLFEDESSEKQSSKDPIPPNLKPPSSNPIGLSPRPKPQIRTRKMNSGRLKLTENPWTTNVWNDGFNAKYTFHNQSIYGSNRG